MRKPLMLDLFAGCGGASMGYYQAGFEVVGVDLFPQDNYPFEFHQADALTYPLQGFDVIHCSLTLDGFNVLCYNKNVETLKPSRVRSIDMTKDELAVEMYALYQSGKSLKDVAKAYNTTHQSVHYMFQRRGWPCRGRNDHIQTTTDELAVEMYALYQSGKSLKDVGEIFHLSPQDVHYRFKKRGWACRDVSDYPPPRLGKGIVTNLDDSDLMALKAQWDTLDCTMKGTVAEGHVKVKLAELGFDVWEPVMQNHTTDMLILCNHRAVRIQVKSAAYEHSTKSFRASLAKHSRADATGKRTSTRYTNEEVDFFIIYCAGLPFQAFYVIPIAEVLRRQLRTVFFPHRNKVTEYDKPLPWERYLNAFDLLCQKRDGI